MPAADWYFDFLSPFSYLQLAEFDRLPPDLEVTYRPVLFAGLSGPLEAQGGPRRFRPSGCRPIAGAIGTRRGTTSPFACRRRTPSTRCARSASPSPRALSLVLIRAIFDAIWAEGRDLSQDEEWQALTARLGIADADELPSPRPRGEGGAETGH